MNSTEPSINSTTKNSMKFNLLVKACLIGYRCAILPTNPSLEAEDHTTSEEGSSSLTIAGPG